MIDLKNVPDEGAIIDITREELGYAPLAPGGDLAISAKGETPVADVQSASHSHIPKPTLPPLGMPRSGPPLLAKTPTVPGPEVYELLTIPDLRGIPVPPMLVRKVMRVSELVVLYAESSAGKTFIAVDISLCVSLGRDWRGRRTRQGNVLYLAGEGITGLLRRIDAWGIENGIETDGLPIQVLPHAVDLMTDAEFERLCATLIASPVKFVLLVIDTVARYMIDGDENSTQDMGKFVFRAVHLGRITGATVLLIHHKGKGKVSERGSSALRGAADVMLEVVVHKCGTIELVGDKSKDDAPLPSMYFKKKVIGMGVDDEGESVSSLVFLDADMPEHIRAEKLAVRAPVEIPAHDEPEPIEDPGKRLRMTLATLFNGEASGGALRDSSGLKRTPHYEALKQEVEAGRIQASGPVRRPVYRLTPLAPEYVSPSPSPASPADSVTDSSRVRESESADTPYGGVSDSNSDSNSDSVQNDNTSSLHQEMEQGGKVAAPPPAPLPPGVLIDNREVYQ